MFQYLRLPSGSARLSIAYITGGVLTIIWTVIWLTYMWRNDAGSQGQYYICTGLIVSGAAFLIIGILMGQIGAQAKGADSDTTAPVNTANPGATAGMVAPVAGQVPMQPVAAPVMMAPGQAAPMAAPGQVPQVIQR